MTPRRAWIQCKAGTPASASIYAAREGLSLLGLDVRPLETLDDIELERNDVVVGFLSFVHEALQRIGVDPPDLDPAPRSLRTFFGRDVVETTLGEVRRSRDPVFVKPRHDHKRFAGHVRDGTVAMLATTASVPDSCVVLTSPPIEILAEWRCFVREAQCVGARPYRGPFDAVPDLSLMRRCIDAYGREAPAAYAIDLGLTRAGETIVVEVNDALALQSYGLPPVEYARVIEARWDEVVGASG